MLSENCCKVCDCIIADDNELCEGCADILTIMLFMID